MTNSANNKSIEILHIEDNTTSCLLVESILEENSIYKLSIALNGKEAYKLLKSKKFDLVILDIMLPDINGFSILKNIRNNRHLKNMPVLIVSAINTPDIYRKAKKYDCNFLCKPINVDDLLQKVNISLTKNQIIGALN